MNPKTGQRTSEPYRPVILAVDDDPNNLAVVRDCLSECDYTLLVAEDGESAIARARFAHPDLILLDVMMPGFDGYETCRNLKDCEATQDIPVIFMTALAETSHKVKGLEAGAVDYITKPFQREELLARIAVHLHIRELTNRLREAKETLEQRVEERTTDLAIANQELEDEIAERQAAQEQLQEQAQILEENLEELQQTQEALRESERKFRAIFDQTFQLMGILSPDGILLEVNQNALNFCGTSEEQVISRPFWEGPWWSHSDLLQEKVKDAVAKAAQGALVRFEATHPAADGTLYFIDFSLKPLLNDQGKVVLLIPEGRDITTMKKLEKELRQSHKMEAIGTLAGGIAHDFNNILTAIIGNTDLAQLKLQQDDPLSRNLERIQEASSRARELVRQILVFSRQGEQERSPVHLSTITGEVCKLLRSTLPSTIEIHQHVATVPGGDTVMADTTQLHQVLMNLGTNAAHAMRHQGGELTISLSTLNADAALLARYPDLKPGHYVRLMVSDTGHGMEEGVKERIFDPYFTTKKVGEGTGMGLAVVLGIIKNHGGAISVSSAPQQGTTFHIFLPHYQGEKPPSDKSNDSLPVASASERILFVDDELFLAELGQEQLELYGYRVTATHSSREALKLFNTDPHAFDLVITDLTMPGLTGRELARSLVATRADIPIILCTGFSEQFNNESDRASGIREIVMKPYDIKSLNTTIRKTLEG